jgi:hypothetical protein
VLFAAKRTIRFQQPPYERPGPDEVLLLRVPPSDEGQQSTWRFPTVGEIEHRGDLAPWTDGTVRADVDAPFTPPDVPAANFQWIPRDFALGCARSVFAAGVMPALRRFDGDLLDQLLGRLETRADSTEGDSSMSSTIRDLQRQVDALQRQVAPPIEGRDKFIAAQSRADSALRAIGDASGAPPPVAGERLLEYRSRLLEPLRKYSVRAKNANLSAIRDANAFDVIEDYIYADAMAAVRNSTIFGRGELRAIREADASGRFITRYIGDGSACWDQFNPPTVRVIRRFNTPGSR